MKPMLRHKLTGQPTHGFVIAALRRYFNQRAVFVLNVNAKSTPTRLQPDGFCKWHDYFKDGVLDIAKPIIVSAIFETVFKKPTNWPSIYASGPSRFYFVFRDVVFTQDDKEVCLFNRKYNKRRSWEFLSDDITGSPFKDFDIAGLLPAS